MLTLFLVALIIVYGLYIFKDGTSIFNNKIYKLSKIREININSLTYNKLLNDGILTYNNEKDIFYNFKGEKVWEKNNNEFPKYIYVNNFLYKVFENKINVIDYEGKESIITLNNDVVLNIKEDNNFFYIITNNNNIDSAYIYSNTTELISQINGSQHRIINICYDATSEKLLLNKFYIKDKSIISNLNFYSNNGDKLWDKDINNEIVISSFFINNEIVIITDKSICLFDKNGNLLWQSNCFNKLIDYALDKTNKSMYLLVQNDGNRELLKITIDGKIDDKIVLSEKFDNIRIEEKNIYIYNDNNLTMINNMKLNTLFTSEEKFIDFKATDNKLYILFYNKFVEGDIINK